MTTSRCLVLLAAFALACGEPTVSPDDAGGDSGTIDGGLPVEGDAAVDAAAVDAAAVDPCAGGACGPCDDGLAIDDGDAANAVRALGLCAGVTAASWILPDGTAPSAPSFALGHGLLDDFGSAVSSPEGARMLAISSGTARTPTDPGFQSVSGFDKGYTSASPAGFPAEWPACPGVSAGSGHDAVALRFTVDVPAGANGFRVLLKHHSTEWPSFLCSAFNDQLAILVDPPLAGSPNGVAFDPMGNPISVNSSFIDVCACAGGPPCTAGGRSFACSEGAAELVGTGFDEAAATPWLEARVPAVAGSSITLTFALWDSGDGVLDSTTLLDGFRWITDAPATADVRPAE